MTCTPNPLVRRCPRLGGPVGFSYCMRCDLNQPCIKVVDCWWETFDIVRYLKDHLTEDQFNRLMHARPKPKVASLVEIIEQAKERMRESDIRPDERIKAVNGSGGIRPADTDPSQDMR